ncbi:sigma factor-like helix-turn-helix DNA-binding protein [Tumebacillus flagellatus]|uniref:RNA polymerase sigma factor 70 region 4 type 2 domain-containing protein n=1 Tax=Tumebacillus flagellatus TaxID=1157490 RepID=A0A074LUZ7_9BACL|nr:sigma factor-like helix-turn-helix DNA-binding protein [Tumebacillus flagellatus]KEO84769.1 hypothetical protein EL26_01800 [Tumebacillus flagellatus]
MSKSQHDLLLQYKKTRRDLRAKHDRTESKEDQALLSQMIGDVEFVIEWLSTGRQPESRRGIDRRSVYELTKVWDPEWFKEFVAPVAATSEYELSLSDEFSLDDAMTGLSERERQCYVLHVGFDYSMLQVAQELNIKKASVQNHLKEAAKKIKNNRTRDMFSIVV